MLPAFNLIVACASNRVIGSGGRLPWRIPEDWEYFRARTSGATVVVGRISFQTWRSVLEDRRRAIVVTRDRSFASDRVAVAGSLTSALAIAKTEVDPIFVCGGQRIFEEAIGLPEATRLYLTLVHAEVVGDRFFPDWHRQFPRIVESRDSADANYRYTFQVLERS